MRLKRILFFFVLITVPLFGTETDLEKAIKFRKGEEYAKAERLLKKYSSPAGFDALKSSEKIDFLRGLLELAHIRALKDDVSGSLSLLNWAEGRKDPYQRAIACVKYAEILLDLGEFERASAYLKNAYEKGYTNGYTATTFKPSLSITANQYVEFMLRALGYSSSGNTNLSDTLDRACISGVLTTKEAASLRSGTFLRADLVYVSYYALDAVVSGSTTTLGNVLLNKGVFTQQEWTTARAMVTSSRK